jgi:hypothetical protein
MAKAACAADTIAGGVLDFIMFGNGQTAPAEKRLFEPARRRHVRCTTGHAHTTGFLRGAPTPTHGTCWQQDRGRDQRPWLAEHPDTVCPWRKVRAQVRMGDRHQTWQYVISLPPLCPTQSITHVSPINCFPGSAHGAVPQIIPGEIRTYVVMPQFPKRADAKNAVCLAALAAGIGMYVRATSAV